jgi:hypothetical protein
MKKTYMKPSMSIHIIKPQKILAGSALSMEKISLPKEEEIINDDNVPGNEVVFD